MRKDLELTEIDSQVELLRRLDSWEKESVHQLGVLLQRYRIKQTNDAAFQKKCHNITRAGGNALSIWLHQQGFRPRYKAR